MNSGKPLLGPVHLGLKNGPLCSIFYTKLEEPYSFSKVSDGPFTQFSDILRVQKEGTQLCISEWSLGLTLTQNVDWGFLLSTTFPKTLMSSGSKKEPKYATLFPQESRQGNPLQVPQRGPYGEKYPRTGHCYFSLNISLFIFPSESR